MRVKYLGSGEKAELFAEEENESARSPWRVETCVAGNDTARVQINLSDFKSISDWPVQIQIKSNKFQIGHFRFQINFRLAGSDPFRFQIGQN